MFALHRILVPTNLGGPSRAAINYGVAFARQFGAKLFLLHVLDAKKLDAALETERVLEVLSPDGAPWKSPQGGDPPKSPEGGERSTNEPSALEIARNAARHDLGQLLPRQHEVDTRAEYLLRASGIGGPGDAIVACARELDVELIVMGKHRLGFVEHLLAGSVAEKVMRHAPCPVLIVQHPEHDFVVDDAPAARAVP